MRVFAITYVIAAALTLVSASPLPIENHDIVSRSAAQCGEVGSAEYCQGIVFKDAQYLCGDMRLGPAMLPKMGPITRVVASWQRFGDLCPAEFIKTWTDSKGEWKYPPFKGFLLDGSGSVQAKDVMLERGMRLDRFGSEFGQFLAPANTPFGARAIPPSNLNGKGSSYHVYEVVAPFPAQAGPTAPWFGQKGRGMQYYVAEKIVHLVKSGKLRQIK
ncbi:hypothetical protein HGRIS_010060 [Hohenbuehelia grisea]|uniref:TNT domain-containing protein n=1 Tax=Hohenbuehelia grisea TaxID=104357 RepID=A0ABR3J3B2_9AGAR